MKHFFILGCPRSGTTMLQQALNRHSQIVVPPETKFFHLFYGQSRRVQRQHLRRLETDLEIPLPALGRERQSPAWARSYFEEMARRYVARRQHGGIVYFGEKTPEHTSQVADIRAVFPQAKFLFLYRDGRDVALSLSRVPWMRCSLYGGFAIWLYYSRFLRQTMRDEGLDVCYVKYEELVHEPAQQLQRICEFLGLDYERRMAESSGNSAGIPERELPWKGAALEPITTLRAGRWRRELSPAMIQNLERLGGETLCALGYPLANPTPEPASRLLRGRLALAAVRCLQQLPWPVLRKEVRRAWELWNRTGRPVRTGRPPAWPRRNAHVFPTL